MTTLNESVTLFNAQTSDTTGSAVKLEPIDKNKPRTYKLFLSGDLGSGTFSIDCSFDDNEGAGTYSNYLLNGETELEQTVLGYSFDIVVDTPMWVKGVLASSTSPTLTAKLYHISYQYDRR